MGWVRTVSYGMIRCFACGANATIEAKPLDGQLVIRCSCGCGAKPQSFRQTPKGWELRP